MCLERELACYTDCFRFKLFIDVTLYVAENFLFIALLEKHFSFKKIHSPRISHFSFVSTKK